MSILFFFQAEDGIRDKLVTGVQTCALPISCAPRSSHAARRAPGPGGSGSGARDARAARRLTASRSRCSKACRRSEERGVGKECRSRWSPYHLKKKKTKIEKSSD